MMLTACAVLLLAAPRPEPPAEPKPPVIRFVEGKPLPGALGLTFEAANPNRTPMPYVGYTPDSFSGGLAGGVIAPIYRVEVSGDGKAWKPHPLGWCGTGIGPVSLPGKGKGTFSVHVPGDWAAVKVGLTWYQGGEPRTPNTAWSDPVTRKAAETPAAKK